MTRRILYASYIIIGLASGVAAHLVLNQMGTTFVETDSPVVVGRINGANIAVHVGDIAVPNRLFPVTERVGGWRLDPRLRYWDAYVLTAPVPKVVSTETGDQLQIPWTLLPGSVVSTVRQLDPQFSDLLEEWLQLKESPAEWHFERLAQMQVPTNSEYYGATAVRRIYAINMFEFVSDLGGDYRQNLTRAISSAVKEVLERSGIKGDQKLAIPALAAAEHVTDKYLVISYEDSYRAILDGISRAKSTPSEIVLVVWHAWLGTPEMSSAIHGLSEALYRQVPERAERLKTLFVGAASIGFLSGVFGGFLITPKKRRSSLFTFIIGLVVVVPIIASYWYLDLLLRSASLATLPGPKAAFLTVCSCLIGHVLQTKGQLAFGRTKA